MPTSMVVSNKALFRPIIIRFYYVFLICLFVYQYHKSYRMTYTLLYYNFIAQ